MGGICSDSSGGNRIDLVHDVGKSSIADGMLGNNPPVEYNAEGAKCAGTFLGVFAIGQGDYIWLDVESGIGGVADFMDVFHRVWALIRPDYG